jgi:hypothetical protein
MSLSSVYLGCRHEGRCHSQEDRCHSAWMVETWMTLWSCSGRQAGDNSPPRLGETVSSVGLWCAANHSSNVEGKWGQGLHQPFFSNQEERGERSEVVAGTGRRLSVFNGWWEEAKPSHWGWTLKWDAREAGRGKEPTLPEWTRCFTLSLPTGNKEKKTKPIYVARYKRECKEPWGWAKWAFISRDFVVTLLLDLATQQDS